MPPETEEALAQAVERIVEVVADRPQMRTRHTMVTVLRAYHFMLEHTQNWYTPESAAITVAQAAECGGLALWMNDLSIVAMGTCWPTDNPNVARHRDVPLLDRDGQYLYFDYCYGIGDFRYWRRLIEFGAGLYPQTRYVCCHDARARRRGNRARGSGRILVRKIHRDALGGRLGKVNGSAIT